MLNVEPLDVYKNNNKKLVKKLKRLLIPMYGNSTLAKANISSLGNDDFSYLDESVYRYLYVKGEDFKHSFNDDFNYMVKYNNAITEDFVKSFKQMYDGYLDVGVKEWFMDMDISDAKKLGVDLGLKDDILSKKEIITVEDRLEDVVESKMLNLIFSNLRLGNKDLLIVMLQMVKVLRSASGKWMHVGNEGETKQLKHLETTLQKWLIKTPSDEEFKKLKEFYLANYRAWWD